VAIVPLPAARNSVHLWAMQLNPLGVQRPGRQPERHRLLCVMQRVIRSVHMEIENYRTAESAKAGRDIGRDWAAQEWLRDHFAEWKRRQWAEAVQQSLRNSNNNGQTRREYE